ncbi:MAG: hypothetical protein GX367_03255 [Bacteroidales bacterium]|nr:hypothetical protein [Bacteroidales bacterium]
MLEDINLINEEQTEDINITEDNIIPEVNENVIIYEINTPDYSTYFDTIKDNLTTIDNNVNTVTQSVYTTNDFYTRTMYLNEFIVFQLFIMTILLIILIFRGVKK